MPPPPEGCSSWLLPQASAQSEALPLGTAWADMLDPAAELAVVDLPVHPLAVLHAYHGEVPIHSHMVRTNGDGCVLFFEVDGNVYDHDGYLIADVRGSGCEQCVEPGVMEMISVPAPGHCELYYLFVSHSGSDTEDGWDVTDWPTRVQVSILDLSKTNFYFTERKGALLNLEAGEQLSYGIELEASAEEAAPNPSPFVCWLSYSYKGVSNTPMLRAIDPSGNGNLFWLYMIGTQAVTEYKIDATGLHWINAGFYDHYQPVKDLWWTMPDKPYYRDAAVARTNDNKVVLAMTDDNLQGWNSVDGFSTGHGPVLILRFNANTGALIDTKEIPYGTGGMPDFGDDVSPGAPFPSDPGTGLTGGPGGIAWVDNGVRLLIQGEAVDPLSNTWKHRIGVFDTGLVLWTDLTDELDVQDPEEYIYARLSTNRVNGPQPAYYLPHAAGLARIDDPVADPAWTASVPVSSAVTPPEFSGYDGDSFYHPLFINAQVTNDQTHITRVLDPVCCETWSAYLGYQGYTFPPAPATVVWHADDNPFGNCNDVAFLTDLIVPPGITLIIYDMTMRFAVDAHFIVRAGAYANVNYSLLTALDCPDDRWPGMRVEGVPGNVAQQPNVQGRVRLWHSEVEEAVVGVWCAREDDPGYFGGIVTSQYSTFTDCIVGARIEHFHRIVGDEQANLSSFYETDFQTTLGWPDPSVNTPKAHIHLYDVNGVKIDRCSFTQSWGFDPHHRGVGIVALDASFRCRGYQDTDDNKFQWLTAGIVNILNDPLFACQVDGMAFDRNLVGIYDMACTYSMVTNNRFTAMTSGVQLDYLTVGMYVDQSAGYVVERNVFEDLDLDLNQEVGSIGIWFHGPRDQDNRIYDNEFHDLTVGNVAEGIHHYNSGTAPPVLTGLQWLCNYYEGELFDQFLLSPDGSIKEQQGFSNPNATAGNVYEGQKDCNSQFEPVVFGTHNSPYVVKYYYYANDDSPDCRPECVEDMDNNNITLTGNYYNLEPVDGQDDPFTPAVHCADGILDAVHHSVQVQKVAYETKYAQLRSALAACNGQLDNGEKEEVLDAINAWPPWPSHQLRGFLLARSPLSEPAILAAINRTQPMDPWHLSQVLIANSRLSGRIWAELDHTGVLSPFFYNMVKEHGSDPSYRELLMEELAVRSYEKDVELRLLVWALHEDSTYAGKLDTLMTTLSTDTLGFGRLVAHQLALSHGRNDDVTALAATMVGDVRYDQWLAFGDLHKQLGYDWSQAQSGDINGLMDMAASGKKLGRGAAWGVLYALDAIDSLPNGVLPMQFRSAAAEDSQENSDAPELGAYPNPARDRLMITCPAGMASATLEILDGQGRVVLSRKTAAGFVEVDVRMWADGLYLARVTRDGTILGETKCAIAR